MALSTIYSAVVAGNKVYSILSGFIASFEKEIEQVYLDMAESHLASAKQCFEAIENSKNPNQELRIGLNHLRDVYNIFLSLKNKKIQKRFIFWNYTSKIPFSDDLRLKIIEIASVIALGYLQLEERENAYAWKKRALVQFDNYKRIYINSLKFSDWDGEHKDKNENIYNEDSYSSERFTNLTKLGEEYALHYWTGGTYNSKSHQSIKEKGWKYVYNLLEKQEHYVQGVLKNISE